jgi:TPR repeat protein
LCLRTAGNQHQPEGNKNSALHALSINLRAFNYFSQIANSHPDEAPGTAQAKCVADAFVALGYYYLNGIPNSKIAPDRARARDMFGYAATYFGDADAQYQLGRLYLTDAPANPRQAVRWLQLAASKNHCAEVALGDLLFEGQVVPRQRVRGLVWLTLGCDCAGADKTSVKLVCGGAFKRASDDERALAHDDAEDWLRGWRDAGGIQYRVLDPPHDGNKDHN